LKPIGIGLVGCGEIAHFHARALAGVGGARVCACYDLDAGNARELAEQVQGRPYPDLDALLSDPAVEAVYVLTRHDSHARIIRQALDAGKHVFTEKPLALTLEEAQLVREAAGLSDRFLMVGFNHRWNPAIRRVLDWQAQHPSPVRSVSLTFATSPFLESWGGLAAEGGGVLPCLGSHALDLACVLLGESPVRLSAFASRLRLEAPYLEDTAAVLLQTGSGALGNLTFHDHAALRYASYATGDPSHLVRAEVFTEAWSAIVESSQQVCLFDDHLEEIRLEGRDPLYILGIQQEDEHFIRCLQNQTPPVPGIDDGVRAVQLVQLAALAAQGAGTQVVERLYTDDPLPYLDFPKEGGDEPDQPPPTSYPTHVH
jgi:myo-inositol 2-dehydrogenase/D-chiro-inositol 1-dehydrogenase